MVKFLKNRNFAHEKMRNIKSTNNFEKRRPPRYPERNF